MGALSIKYIKNIFSSYTTNKCSGNVTFYHRYKADPEFLETTSQKKMVKRKIMHKGGLALTLFIMIINL